MTQRSQHKLLLPPLSPSPISLVPTHTPAPSLSLQALAQRLRDALVAKNTTVDEVAALFFDVYKMASSIAGDRDE